ncbi:efflux RND transporter periplasmic adaptor subunit [Peribacillus castrilensis]|uniref:Biotin/lipoyl attachment domain-containing protein n=1 Tax=Peribacillus simplex TaxID=1478 RepID=A0AAN2PCM3_9BACI|nr:MULTISPECIES: efflux RND transporter periplasmic adaptor subunit [Bacillaceae]MCP1092922.1 efflux RND transporter periplasmic adaptor subunit [Bacillaceae bacterium OS4b]MBD8586967.1 efflux RND transporter periplasmic adaptor subunit [Peribacillus simplex]MCF7625347.1 efflux RND transporter periplasmic adaptor subunit [Peribacillus frigoritolerans]MCP1155883.1 efflux RND transporter periplasmic adaptor subunit [Peribacillus frigoritolerans]MCT1387850.1 efflux RND transporter periplasmic ada
MKKLITIGTVLVLAIGGSVWFFMKDNAEPAIAKSVTATVEKGDLEVQISGSGSVAAINSEDITSSITGEVDEVLVEKNELVEKGDELITFTDGSDPITAPFDGTVTTMDVEEGDRVSSSEVLAHVTDYKKLKTTISVDELDVPSVKKGQTVEIKASAFEDETFTGEVTSVAKEGTYENGVSSFDVTIKIDKPGDIKIGMSTEVSILTTSVKDALYVPIEAVQIDGEEKYVNIQQSDTTEGAASTKKVVETGISNDRYIEITSGLEEGQFVSLPITINESSTGSGVEGMRGGQGGEVRMQSGSGMPSGGMPNGGGMPSGKGGQ